jgi:1-deoxy-D-xylulose-5-phosphate reductoisomerase
MTRKGVTVLGSTGSIGRNTLDVIARHPDRFHVVALTARHQWQLLLAQAVTHRPRLVVLVDGEHALKLEEGLRRHGLTTEVLVGAEALEIAATLDGADCVMAAIVGAAGLSSTLAAARAGRRVLLANKEALVMSGPLLLDAVRHSGAELLPIDSEHNAIFQCLPPSRPGVAPTGVRRVWLTASGGPFLRRDAADFASITPQEAVAHPRWSMGAKISVDSATLMNKGLELIEAQLLFGMAPGSVEVVVHPQSIVHSLVEYTDGSTLAQLGNPDMRTPIAHALGWPDRIESGVQSLDMLTLGSLRFEAPDRAKFRCLVLAEAAGRAGGTAPTLLNAANEVAVDAFLGGRLNFVSIPMVIDEVLQRVPSVDLSGLEGVLAADAAARQVARQVLAGQGEMI